MTAAAQTLRTDDDEPLTYAIHGGGAATPILTAHGLVSSDQHWRAFVPHFAARRAVVSWDYRGHGGLPAPRTPAAISVARFADDGAAVWRAAAQPPAIVAGLSFGVQVALELWRRHPAAVRALVLICGTPGHPLDRLSAAPGLRRAAAGAMRWLGAHPALAARLLAPLRAPLGVRVARELAYLSGGAHRAQCPVDVLEGLFAHVASLDPAVIAAVTAAYFEHDAADVLASIAVPTLIIAGDRDQLTPVAIAERMHRTITGSRLVVFPGHSHLVQVERPADVHAAIDGFLADHGL